MSQQNGGDPNVDNGFNSSVEYEGRRYQVQTQVSTRDAPVVESLVFHDGRALVRITSSYGEVAHQVGFTEDDGRHLLELQHADLIRKIRHGMLRNDDAPASAGESCLPDVESRTADPSEFDEPAVQELLQDLGETVDRIATPPRPRPTKPRPTASRTATTTPRRSRFRFAIRIVLPF